MNMKCNGTGLCSDHECWSQEWRDIGFCNNENSTHFNHNLMKNHIACEKHGDKLSEAKKKGSE